MNQATTEKKMQVQTRKKCVSLRNSRNTQNGSSLLDERFKVYENPRQYNWFLIQNLREFSNSFVILQVMNQWGKKVRSSSSLEELLRLTDFPDWKLWKCRLRLQQPEAFSSPPSAGPHRSTRYAAESYSLEILKGFKEDYLHIYRSLHRDGHSLFCLVFSHRWRVAADSVYAKGNVRGCGQGAEHWPFNVLQAAMCVGSQVGVVR